MEPEGEYEYQYEAETVEVEETVMDDGMNAAADGGYPSDYGYSDERNGDSDDIDERNGEHVGGTVMDTQTGDVIVMDGEVCNMDMGAVDIGCKDSPPLPDKAADNQTEDTNQLRMRDQDEFLQKNPEKLKIPSDGSWVQGEAKESEVEEEAPPVPVKRGNTKSRIQMFESL